MWLRSANIDTEVASLGYYGFPVSYAKSDVEHLQTLEKLRKTSTTCLQHSILTKTILIRLTIASTIESPLRKPICSSEHATFLFKKRGFI